MKTLLRGTLLDKHTSNKMHSLHLCSKLFSLYNTRLKQTETEQTSHRPCWKAFESFLPLSLYSTHAALKLKCNGNYNSQF